MNAPEPEPKDESASEQNAPEAKADMARAPEAQAEMAQAPGTKADIADAQAPTVKEEMGSQYRERMDNPEDTGEFHITAFENPLPRPAGA